MYSQGWKKSYTSPLFTIGIGNLKVGGTGKTPFSIYLLHYFIQKKIDTAFLSRGYGRKTKGYIYANENTSPNEIGDEPFMVYQKFNRTLPVAVSEKRQIGLEKLPLAKPELQAVVLDDVFQHRSISPDIMILLTEYKDPFYKDMLLPGGMLREARINARRADVVVVTKSPENPDKKKWIAKIRPWVNPETPVFFSSIRYLPPTNEQEILAVQQKPPVLLVSALGNPKPLEKYIREQYPLIKHFSFIDHYKYSIDTFTTIDTWLKEYDDAIVITTEKDWHKIKPFIPKSCRPSAWYFLPIELSIHDEPSFISFMNSVLKQSGKWSL